nr:immunoglobulin heavy chain junction region [Macaca mulatta]MOV49733.1 immunoglobulin heavy chain junction region [Macaca mulatta]MOV49915.1 immunoglobulin heavy chain junction region [Macaca mulatta]MOV49981.1 immunoglobulin heavy chain junction region [Macaca mulatta]MOV50262.1 immunoglobulin heavy chain junction region [Macaca mulatta]
CARDNTIVVVAYW